MSSRMPLVVVALCIVALLSLSGCASGPTWEPAAGTLTSAQLTSMLETTDASKLRTVAVSDARDRRDRALAALRSEDGGSEVADVLTKTFAQGNTGVPLYVGVGEYLGRRAIFVIEAYGPQGGTLDHKRLWVLSFDGTPVYTSTSK